MDSLQSAAGRPEPGKDWVERLQWLGIKVEEPREKGETHSPSL